MKPIPDIANLTFTRCQYGAHHLQRVGVWTTPSARGQPADVLGGSHHSLRASYWVVFIHGGGWRDPRNTFEDFIPSIKAILGSSQIPSSAVRGFASIDYRLSPHPNFPQDLARTPTAERRDARHPDHLLDIRAALAYLDKEYSIGQDYILMGHSAGATLTYQLLMGDAALAGQVAMPVSLPRAAIGISGIYDLNGLVRRFEGVHGGIYRNFVTGAFGSDEELWKTVSPVNNPSKYIWPGVALAMLAWSPDDTMIDEPEIDCMMRKLEADGAHLTVVKDLNGDHEVVWEQGQQIVRLVAEAIEHIDRDSDVFILSSTKFSSTKEG